MEELNKIIIPILPCPAPRMTKADKWRTNPNHPDPKKRQRPRVTRYFQFKNDFLWLCKQQKYSLKPILNVVFIIPMPSTWSKKKKEDMYLTPHQTRPDIDNLCKSFMDAFGVDDGFVYDIRARKYWGKSGEIWIYE